MYSRMSPVIGDIDLPNCYHTHLSSLSQAALTTMSNHTGTILITGGMSCVLSTLCNLWWKAH